MGKIGWRFPLTDGGTEDGYNNPGMAHFGGSPLGSLARETIQNSLDAKTTVAENVQVVFDVVRVGGRLGLGRAQLAEHVKACVPIAEGENNPRAVQELKRALRLLEKDEITFLRVADYNTIGLDRDRWKALVKSQGLSHKQDRIAGGSHGIGKYAPFVVSQLRTVFYWSESSAVRYCQGKAVLMSHPAEDGVTRGDGFFGVREGCENLKGHEIPQEINDIETERSAPGTSLWIAGFADDVGWQIHVARSVVESYFCAIAEGSLEVLVEPEAGQSVFKHWEINRRTLSGIFADLLREEQGGEDDGELLREAYAFYRTLEEQGSVVREREDADLGYCRLWIRVEEGLPGKVGLIRKSGMLITAKQNKLLRFPNLQDFAAVLRFESEQGNELLRDMENPAHNQFEPDRLDEERRQRGKRALNRVVSWVREQLRDVAASPSTGTSEAVAELAHLLPDLYPDESFGDGEGVDRGFGTSDVIRLRPVRRTRNASLPDESANDAGNDAELEEGSFGSTDPEEEGHNEYNESTDKPGGQGRNEGADNTGGGRARQMLTFRDFRLLPQHGDGIRIAFTPTEDAKAVRLDLAEAGDSNTVPRGDLRVVTSEGEAALSTHSLDFVAGQRVVLEVVGDKALDHRAWRLQLAFDGDRGTRER